MFDPRIGRWTSEDPLGFEAGDENLYRYVGNSPTNYTDPSGLDYLEGSGVASGQGIVYYVDSTGWGGGLRIWSTPRFYAGVRNGNAVTINGRTYYYRDLELAAEQNLANSESEFNSWVSNAPVNWDAMLPPLSSPAHQEINAVAAGQQAHQTQLVLSGQAPPSVAALHPPTPPGHSSPGLSLNVGLDGSQYSEGTLFGHWSPSQLFDGGPSSFSRFWEHAQDGYWEMVDVVDVGTSFVPVFSDYRDVAEFTTGMNLITGQPLEPWERVVTGACIVLPFVGATVFRHADGVLHHLDDVDYLRHNNEIADAIHAVPMHHAPSRHLPSSITDPDQIREVNNTLDSIASGGPFPYSRDGIVFHNREGLLPPGNYQEYTVITPGAPNRGAQRIVVDNNTGRTYYTSDHYQSFIEIDPTVHP